MTRLAGAASEAAFRDYARHGRNALWRYLVAPPLALLLSLLFGTLVVVALMIAGVHMPATRGALLDPAHPATFMGMTGAAFACLLAGFLAAVRLAHGKRLVDMAGDWRWGRFWAGVGIWTAVLALLAAVDARLAPGSLKLVARPDALPFAAAALLALAPQTFAEELIFRGYLTQGLLLALRRPLPAAVASGALFALLHLPNGAPQAASALVFGVLLSLIAIRQGGLAFTFGLHLANNLFGSVIVVSSSDVFKGAPGVFAQNAPQLMWWDAFASAAVLSAIALAIARAKSATLDPVSRVRRRPAAGRPTEPPPS